VSTSSSPPPPASTLPDSTAAPSSTAPPSEGAASAPASADTIQQALDAVKAAFPAGSSPLVDLRLDASDDQTASITMLLDDAHPCASPDMQAVVDALTSQFQSLSIGQEARLSFVTDSPDSSDGPPSSGPASSPSSSSSSPSSG
jgi:hypothetical protein